MCGCMPDIYDYALQRAFCKSTGNLLMGELSQSDANLVLGKLFVLWDFQGQPRRQRIIPADDCFVWIERLSSLFCTAFPPILCPSRTAFEFKISVLSSKCATLYTVYYTPAIQKSR